MNEANPNYRRDHTLFDNFHFVRDENAKLTARLNVLAAGFLLLADKHPGETYGEVEVAALVIAHQYAPWETAALKQEEK